MNDREQISIDSNKDLFSLKKFIKYNYERNKSYGIAGTLAGLIYIILCIHRGIDVGIGYFELMAMLVGVVLILLSFLLLSKKLIGDSFFIFWVLLFSFIIVLIAKSVWNYMTTLFNAVLLSFEGPW